MTRQGKIRNSNIKCSDFKIRNAARTALIYLGVAAFCAFFGIVYESFSHGVYSPFMIWAFAFPLVLGAAPYLIFWGLSALGKSSVIPCPAASYSYAFGIAALTCGSIMRGVLDIYGTTNSLLVIYWIAGGILTVSGFVLYMIQQFLSQLSRSNC